MISLRFSRPRLFIGLTLFFVGMTLAAAQASTGKIPCVG